MGEAVGETDRYVDRWSTWTTGNDGPLGGSTLTPVSRGEFSVTYTVAVRPGACLYEMAVSQREWIASALGVSGHRLVFDAAPWLGDAGKFQLTIVEEEFLAKPRQARAPDVFNGVLLNAGRYVDGLGVTVPMWTAEHGRTMPLGLVGPSASGRSNALLRLAAGAEGSGAMNMLLVEPAGFREQELRRQARVALVGERAARQVWAVLDAIVAARQCFVSRRGQSYLPPTAEMPGWMVIIADVGATVGEVPGASDRMRRFLRHSDRLGLWTVAVAESMQTSEWGSDLVRERFVPQMFGFISPGCRPGGLGFNPQCAAVPDGAVGCAMANFGARKNVPFRWDVQPGDEDAAARGSDPRLAQTSLTRSAVDTPVHRVDAAAITGLLGAPSADGRWDRGYPA